MASIPAPPGRPPLPDAARHPDPLADSGLVICDKPAGMTSHDVVGRLRRAFGTKKVGHAGTLDPMATGVLIIGINRGTKFLAHMVAATKAYEATIRLGQSTTTDDAEGDPTGGAPATLDLPIDAAVARLTGDIMQRPAAVSAIKIAGRRAYERVRSGEQVELPARPVTVSQFDVLRRREGEGLVDIDVAVRCSSGTYIRALARDLGEALRVGGHLTRLRRTEVGPFALADATPLDGLAAHPRLSLSLDEAMTRCYPALPVTVEEARALSLGKKLPARDLEGVAAAVDPDGRAVALVREKDARVVTIFVARPATL